MHLCFEQSIIFAGRWKTVNMIMGKMCPVSADKTWNYKEAFDTHEKNRIAYNHNNICYNGTSGKARYIQLFFFAYNRWRQVISEPREIYIAG